VHKSTNLCKFESFHLHLIYLLRSGEIPLHLLLLFVDEARMLASFACDQVDGTIVLFEIVVNLLALCIIE
jgi:hypothetical protein